MIELKDIEFSYRKGASPALRGITATLPEGIHLVVGENGAGKTTMLHIIAGLIRPQKGACVIDGANPASARPSEMGKTFLLEENQHFPGKTIREFAAMHSRFYKNFSPQRFCENLIAFGLTGDESMKSLSLGNRKKTQLAYVLALGVEVLLLDEPTNALDIQGRETLRRLMAASLCEGQTILVSTHSVEELSRLFDGAIIITRSDLLFAGTEEYVSDRLVFRVGRVPEPDALYSEIQVGRVLSVSEAFADDEPTKVDWRLLYSALHSPKRDEVLNCLNRSL